MLDLTFFWILAALFAGFFVVRGWADRASRTDVGASGNRFGPYGSVVASLEGP